MVKLKLKSGASALSYGLVVGLIAVVSLGAVTTVGGSVDSLFTDVSDTITTVNEGTSGSASASPAASGEASPTCGSLAGVPQLFSYTGGSQSFTVPLTGIYQLEVWGAEGGTADHMDNSTIGASGLGGYATGRISLVQGESLQVEVGGMGITARTGNGGYNGGGNTTVNPSTYGNTHAKGRPGTGGGATDIRYQGSTLNDRIIVGGGGGGGSKESNDNDTATDRIGGHGGGLTGGSGETGGAGANAFGGTQLAGGDNPSASGGTPGSFGQGGNGNSNDAGGGGGGWYGGEGGNNNGAGAGGSSYMDGSLTNTSTQSGQRSGNGEAQITLIGCT